MHRREDGYERRLLFYIFPRGAIDILLWYLNFIICCIFLSISYFSSTLFFKQVFAFWNHLKIHLTSHFFQDSTAQCTELLDKLFVHLYIQSTKILLVPPKCQIMVLCQIDNFFNMAIAILDFSLLLPYSYCFSNFAIVKVVALCFILCRAFID